MEHTKKLSRKEQAAATKKKILETAFALFKEHSFADTSIEMLTKAAGISKGAFYVHYSSKISLLAEMISIKINELDNDYELYLENQLGKRSTSDVLLGFSEKIMRTMTDVVGYEYLCLMYSTLLSQNETITWVDSHDRKLFGLVRKILEQGMTSGEFSSSLPLDVIAEHIIIAYRGLTYEWCSLYPDFNLQAASRDHLSLIIEGLEGKNKN